MLPSLVPGDVRLPQREAIRERKKGISDMRTLLLLSLVFMGSATAAAAPGQCPAKMLIRKDGVAVLDGTAYSDMKQLELHLRALQRTQCPVSLTIDKDARYDALVRAMTILQATGTTKIGFAAAGPGHP